MAKLSYKRIALRTERKERRQAGRAYHPITVSLQTGEALLKAGLYSEAVLFFLEAINIVPSNTLGYLNLGRAYTKLERYLDAVQAYRDGLCIDKNSSRLLLDLGNLLNKLGRYNEACEVFEQLVRVKRHDYMAHRLLAMAYLHAGRPQEEIAAFSAAQRLSPAYMPTSLSPAVGHAAP